MKYWEWKKDPILMEYLKLEGSAVSPVTAVGQKKLATLAILRGDLELIDCRLACDEDTFAWSIFNSKVFFIEPPVIGLINELAMKLLRAYEAAANKPAPKRLPLEPLFLTAPRGFKWGEFEPECNFSFLTQDKDDLTVHRSDFQIDKKIYVKVDYQPQALSDAICLFIEEKILKISETRVNRQFKKGLEKAGAPLETIRVISLRAYDYDGPQSEGVSQEYTRQWIVRGHPRAQWYPSLNQHQWIWIDPYKKGPEGAPFIESVRHVCR